MVSGERAEPFTIEISTEVLEDLQSRLRQTRFPPDFGNDDWSYGFSTAYLRELVRYWAEEFDWRAQEAAMNAYRHSRTTVQGVPVHTMVSPGAGPDPMPILLLHGYPWTYWDFHKVIGPLSDPAAHGGDPADSFDVVVMSLPGFGFSSPLTQTGWNFHRTADLVAELMTDKLGYTDGFAVAGGDWGALVAAQLGHKHADKLIGVFSHTPAPLSFFSTEAGDRIEGLDYAGSFPAPSAFGEGETGWSDANALFVATETAFTAINITKPQTIAAALNDSPSGLMAWIAEKRRTWADSHGDVESVWTKDELCTAATIYWVTETAGSAARFYREAVLDPWSPSHDRRPVVEAPFGASVFTNDVLRMPSAWTRAYHDLRQYRVHEAGGHFAPVEQPQVYLTDVRDFFRDLRS